MVLGHFRTNVRDVLNRMLINFLNERIQSLLGTLKSGLVNDRRYRTRDEARSDLSFCIEAFYNRSRR